MKTGCLLAALLGLVFLAAGCLPPAGESDTQPRDKVVIVSIGDDCYVKIRDTLKQKDKLELWRSRPVEWKNRSDRTIVVEFDGEPLIAGREHIRLRPGESVRTRVSSRMKTGRYQYIVRCLGDRGGDDKEEEEEEEEDESSVDYDVKEPPPKKEQDPGGP